ncbi:MAG: glycosyltransferase family 87 protein [Terracidiphilus sp.]|jgi:hypothetical protein
MPGSSRIFAVVGFRNRKQIGVGNVSWRQIFKRKQGSFGILGGVTMQMDSRTNAHRAGISAFLLGTLLFLLIPLRGFSGLIHESSDFAIVYSSSKCLIDSCNPYDSADTHREYIKSEGDMSAGTSLIAFRPYQALYPPSTLFWIVPFASLPWKPALALWLTMSAILFAVAAFLVSDLFQQRVFATPFLLLGIFISGSGSILAQPSSFAISLSVIGVWCLLRNRFPNLGILCFALSVALKPQVGGLVVVYFLLVGGQVRRRSVAILVAAALLCIPGFLWVSKIPAAAHWYQDLSVNIATSTSPGGLNDPGPTNWWGAADMTSLQSLVAVFVNTPRIYNPIAWGVFGCLLLIWAHVTLRAKPSYRKDILGVATIACLALLPVYHRTYDLRLLILVFPAIALLFAEEGIARMGALINSLLLIVCSHPHTIRETLKLHQDPRSPIWNLMLLCCPMVALLSSIFFLVYYARTLNPMKESAAQELGAETVCLRSRS